MGRFSALLIGAAHYGENDSLHFVHRDLAKLGEALRDRAVEVVRPRPREGGQVTANFVNGEVIGFLKGARPGDRLMICLSGHGTHIDGQDYLVPEDIHPEVPYKSGCVAIDWKEQLQNTKAAQVLITIDACRQGVRDSMARPTAWATAEVRAVAGRKVARLYACSPGELARFKPAAKPSWATDDGSFSLFSRAMRDVLVAHDGPLDLGQLCEQVQGRVAHLHRETGRTGAVQAVKLLTDVVQSDFVVVEARRTAEAPAAPAEPTPEPPPEPQTAKSSKELVADVVFQVVRFGRSEHLEQFAAEGPAPDLLELSRGLPDWAVHAMWTAAARGRAVEPLVELMGALYGAGQPDLVHWLVESAVFLRPVQELPLLLAAPGMPPEAAELFRLAVIGVAGGLSVCDLVGLVLDLNDVGLAAEAEQVLGARRPLEDLPELLDALEAAGLRHQADLLVLRIADTDDLWTLEQLLSRLAESGRDPDRVAVLSAIAIGPMDRLVAWLASGASQEGKGEDSALVLHRAVAWRTDGYLLPAALRRTGQDEHLRTVHEEMARLELSLLHARVECLSGEGAVEDARAVIACAVEPFCPVEVAELASLIRQRGPADLLPIVFAALCRARADQVADFLRTVKRDAGGGLFGESVSMLVKYCPVAELSRLAAMVDDGESVEISAELWHGALDHRPMADLLVMLERTPEAEQPQLLDVIVKGRSSPGDLAELVEMPGHPALRDRLGSRAAVGQCAYDDEVLKDVLAELGSRHWEAGSSLLITRIVRTRSPDQQAVLAVRLAADGYVQQALALVAGACEERGTASVGDLAERLLTGSHPQLLGHVLDHAAERWCTRDLVRLARRLAATGARARSQPPAQGVAYLLSRAVERRAPEATAELLLALDAEPDGQQLVRDLLAAYLTDGRPEETVSRITHLRGAEPGSRVARGVSEVVRANAPVLFHVARNMGSAQAAERLLTAYGDREVVRPSVLKDLLAELRGPGADSEADFVRDMAVRSQPPDAVAALLVMLRAGSEDDFVAACCAVAERPTREVAVLMARLSEMKGAIEGFAWWYAQKVDQGRCRALLCELFRRGDDGLAGKVLNAAPWSRSAEAVAAVFLDADRQGLRRVGALNDLAAGLEPAQAAELIGYLVGGGATSLARDDLLQTLARSTYTRGTWTRLQTLGRFEHAAALLDRTPPDTDVMVWYRDLLASPVEIDRSAIVAALGADRPFFEESDIWGWHRALLATAVLFRPPSDVADELVRMASSVHRSGLAERWRILAGARPVPELAEVIWTLMNQDQEEDACRIVDAMLSGAGESIARVGELLEVALGPSGQAAASVVARVAMDSGTADVLIRKLLDAGYTEGTAHLRGALAGQAVVAGASSSWWSRWKR
ncbi:hypothetical protein VM98_01825 [Streptomyces rubellomurinus subsp. indigoferus]|nr:hypothetical protein VM98_01825 [Streptomyces rubellomurinus subsp. indigoferus]